MKYRPLGLATYALALPAAIARRPELKWMNRGVSTFYRRTLTPWLEKSLSRQLREPGLKLRSRHSVHQEDRFNLFESDLDFSVLLPSPSSSGRIVQELKSRYLSWRRLLPFLGEIEIYEPWEWELREKLLADSRLLKVLWNLRKWLWVEEKHRKASSPYYVNKAEYSTRWIRRELGLDPGSPWPESSESNKIGQALMTALTPAMSEAREASLEAPSGFRRRSDYLGWFLLHGLRNETGERFALSLDSDELLTALAILPDSQWVWPEGIESLRTLRGLPQVARLHGLVCLNEYLIYQSVKRTSEVPPGDSQNTWENYLLSAIPAGLLRELGLPDSIPFSSPLRHTLSNP